MPLCIEGENTSGHGAASRPGASVTGLPRLLSSAPGLLLRGNQGARVSRDAAASPAALRLPTALLRPSKGWPKRDCRGAGRSCMGRSCSLPPSSPVLCLTSFCRDRPPHGLFPGHVCFKVMLKCAAQPRRADVHPCVCIDELAAPSASPCALHAIRAVRIGWLTSCHPV